MRPIRVVAKAALLVVAFAMLACVQMPVLGRSDLLVSAVSGPVSYRALSAIPERPEPAPAAMREQAIDALTEEREAATQAASRLRAEPFSPPAPFPGPETP